ncbi:MAG: amidohydrolase family protein, partial [bacterium]
MKGLAMKSVMIFFVLALSFGVQSQTMTVEEYDPVSTLVVPETILTRAKYPFIDVHRHHFKVMDAHDLDSLAADMDKVNLAVYVNLSGRGRSIFFNPRPDTDSDVLETSLKNIQASKHHNRFILFTNIRFNDIDDPDWGKRTVQRLERDVKLGARGLKIYKDLGLTVKDKSGKRIAVDDPRLDPIWAKCGELGIPVLIHSGEPISFWKPKDKHNERWLELKMFP